ncbi:hypothetical protein, partial [Pseudomonas sp. MHK4]
LNIAQVFRAPSLLQLIGYSRERLVDCQAVFAGKPAPTKARPCLDLVDDIYLVGAGLPAKAILNIAQVFRAPSLLQLIGYSPE